MKFYKTLREANVARDKEWNTTGSKLSPIWWANALGGEAGEACNILKKLERERIGLPGSRATVAQLAEELADVVICCDLLCISLGVTFHFDDLSDNKRADSESLHGASLLVLVGELCVLCIENLLRFGIADLCTAIDGRIRSIAIKYGIDLEHAVANKFNATSEKVGLETRMEVPE